MGTQGYKVITLRQIMLTTNYGLKLEVTKSKFCTNLHLQNQKLNSKYLAN